MEREVSVVATLKLGDVERAWEARDPSLAYLVMELARSGDDTPETPPREGALTWATYQNEVRSWSFRRKTREEQARYRMDTLRALEAPDAEVPLPDRLRLHTLIMELWADNGAWARRMLLEIIAGVELRYGVWRALKQIFKAAEAAGDWEIYGALLARLDMLQARRWGFAEVSAATLAYLVRRGWRQLRRLAVSMPSSYADAASSVLACYPDDTSWGGTWVANHIFFHETRKYNRNRFKSWGLPSSLIKQRAYGELWQRSPRPLFSLLERAQSEHVRRYAADALRADFRASIREVEPAWVARLVGLGSAVVDEFAVWVLESVPRFEQAAFRELGLHEAALRLLDSRSTKAQEYAASYARAHARDLPVDELVRLAGSSTEAVSKLATDLLGERDPRAEVGLDAWGLLLEQSRSHDFAAGVLRKHFGARELTPAWFRERLLSSSWQVRTFAQKHLPTVHPWPKLGAGFLLDFFSGDAPRAELHEFLMSSLERFDVDALDAEALRRLLVYPADEVWGAVAAWINAGKVKAERLGADFFKTIAFHLSWEQSAWLADLKARGPAWARDVEFHEDRSALALEWLADVRRFSPDELGFSWLMQLVERSEPRYHDFAVETMIKSFVPADFAEKAPEEAAPAASAPAGPVTVDLGGASFLFTGKMATLVRKDAENQVRSAGGAVASGVTAKLDYLVIGDDGSPLYGQGRKGSKQVAAEKLVAGGAPIKIISETAFLQMLAGEVREFSAEDATAGAARLWSMAVDGAEDSPLSDFALTYLRRHHVDIGLAMTDRPVDPGAEIPAEFLTFARVKPLLVSARPTLRALGLELARWELARWAPAVEELVVLAESPYEPVRTLVRDALLAAEGPEHRRIRLDPAKLSAAAAYAFCESPRDSAREIGMALIQAHPRLQLPEELFRLSESPDRQVRAFVVRTLWSMYRARGITAAWRPEVLKEGAPGRRRDAAQPGVGAPARPANLPAPAPELRDFLRRMLYELPPAKAERRPEDAAPRLRPLPARKAKLGLVEVLRDVAVEDGDFAAVVFPLLSEFMGSVGKSEREACLVATTRIRKAHPAAASAVEVV